MASHKSTIRFSASPISTLSISSIALTMSFTLILVFGSRDLFKDKSLWKLPLSLMYSTTKRISNLSHKAASAPSAPPSGISLEAPTNNCKGIGVGADEPLRNVLCAITPKRPLRVAELHLKTSSTNATSPSTREFSVFLTYLPSCNALMSYAPNSSSGAEVFVKIVSKQVPVIARLKVCTKSDLPVPALPNRTQLPLASKVTINP